MKKVQVIFYSQSGQLRTVIESFCAPLVQNDQVEVLFTPIEPTTAFPYPWRFYEFFDAMAESVLDRGCAIEPVAVAADADLVILGYTVWFLSPSPPVAAFLNSPPAQTLAGKPVVTLIACRDMWLMAQERVKAKLSALGATHLDNVVLTDQGKSLYSFVTTPRWLLTGKKTAFWFFPPAGVATGEIALASRFGDRLLTALAHDQETKNAPLLTGLGAVRVADKLIASEKIALKSFRLWSRLMAWAGPASSFGRRTVVSVYILFLILMIAAFVPLNLIKNGVAARLNREKAQVERRYYQAPSGE
ncbi:MAG: dialkylresorcinol condensing enzyme [Desulfobulbus sp.]|nr:dialkylresorcinol condensing enzyme [Desulfobulbus sp.]